MALILVVILGIKACSYFTINLRSHHDHCIIYFPSFFQDCQMIWPFIGNNTLGCSENSVVDCDLGCLKCEFVLLVYKNSVPKKNTTWIFIQAELNLQDLSELQGPKMVLALDLKRSCKYSDSSQFQGLCSTKSSSFKICHILYIWKSKVALSVFNFMLLYFFPNECPSLCRHRPGH